MSRRVDWDLVPVVITGQPNPDALRAIAESVRDFAARTAVEGAQPETFRKKYKLHVFHCKPCQKCWMGSDLWKTVAGQYVCLDCNRPVQDVTEAPLGRSFMQTVRPDWSPST